MNALHCAVAIRDALTLAEGDRAAPPSKPRLIEHLVEAGLPRFAAVARAS